MINRAMDAFVVFFLLFQITEAFDKFLTFRESNSNHWTFVCAAEDNGDALVWNSDKNWKDDTIFNSTYTRQFDYIDCPNVNNYCQWRTEKWIETDWKKNPMGPVLDTAWEDFKEYNNRGNLGKYEYVDELPIKGALAFSIRGSTEAEIVLCGNKSYKSSKCLSIVFGDKETALIYVQLCSPAFGFRWPCSNVKNSINKEELRPTEWKHYVLTWDSNVRNLTLYNDEKQLITYASREALNAVYLFYKSLNLMHIRFHQYSYFFTTQKLHTLQSILVDLENNNLCFRLSIGLCSKCSANISLYADRSYHYKETLIKVNGTTSIHGLPTWQHVKVNMSVSKIVLGTRVSAQITPIYEGENNTKGFWAVRNIMKCPPPETMKISRRKYEKQNKKNNLPEITCQRISYTRNEVIKAHTKVVELETDDYDCPNGTMCSLSCSSFDKGFDKTCENIVICDTKNCTCMTGFMGTNCKKKCRDDTYGYMCQKTCGRCLKTQCHFKTGLCPDQMCNNTDVYRIPPYCKTEINAPPAPTIVSFNETSVHAKIIPPNEYKIIKTEYNFVIENEEGTFKHIHPNRPIFQNTTTLEVTIDKLKHGTYYWILCNLIISNENKVINGSLKRFNTSCTVNNDFKIDAGVKNLTIMAHIPKKILYPCPFNLYNVTIKEIDTDTIIYEEPLSEMPFSFKKLEPATDYEVIINNKENEKNISFIVHTKDGVSSPVTNLGFDLFNDINVNLTWGKPKNPNGKIKEYEVILNITAYRGCVDLKRDTQPTEFVRFRTNITNITFCDLQPYITYTAIIYAWNSNRGEAASVIFSTAPTKILKFDYTNLRKEDDKLLWDPPKDCKIISGPIKATKLHFIAVRHILRNHTYVLNKTDRNLFDLTKSELYGQKRYKVYLYPIKDYNETRNSSASLEFETPPKAPLRVKNLEIVEVNTYKNIILLRWQEPFPSNGNIDHYSVADCFPRNCIFYIENVPKNNYCPLWDTYICATITQNLKTNFIITVYAINENVKEAGPHAYIFYNKSKLVDPDQPENVTVEVYSKKPVTLSWLHPWRTRLPLEKFSIDINVIDTKLRHQISNEELHKKQFYFITKYKRKYSMDLDLIPSTRYMISVYPVTINGTCGKSNNATFVTSASMAFEEHLSYRFYSDTIICLKIPKIAYETTNSKIYFVVKGKKPCKEHVKLNQFLKVFVNVKSNEVAWLAASSFANKYSDNEFCVGDNRTYPGNCPLIMQHFYTVIVIVQADENSTIDEVIIESIQFGNLPKRHYEIWAVPVVIILIISIVVYYICRRRIRKMPRKDLLTHKHISIVYKNKEIASTIPSSLESIPLCQSRANIASLSVQSIPNEGDPIMPIKVKDFEDYVKNAVNLGLLDEQYKMFPRGLMKPCNYGKLPENITKNRYKNLVAYDETRVILEKQQDDPFSDYINANYIKGHNMEKRYIATQGPKPNTIIDFWRMIWQENVLVICMLANIFEQGKAKCEQYWPEIGKKKKYGDVKVFNVKHDVFADYTFRILHVTCDGETRQVKHLHYTTWPDHGVPLYTYSVVTYLKKLLAIQIGNGPLVVHCSAGVGRTGTIILCDICLRRAATEGVVDVFSETRLIRDQRVNMVDNKQQYLFAHLVLVECLLAIPTSLPCDQNLPAKINEMKKQLNIQFKRLEDTMWQNEALRPNSTQILSELNIAKHRYPELISKKAARIYLRKYPLHAADSDYIAAVYVDGLKTQNQYLASQLPLPSTCNDFWRMVAEFQVELIIVLQSPDPNDPTCCSIVPTNGEFKPTPYLSVITGTAVNNEYYISHKLKLVDSTKKIEPEQSITILSSTKYESGRNKDPPPVEALVQLWQATERISRGDNPTVVLCHDGVTGCGLYLALSFLLEKMAIERECDVCLAIQTVKRSRPDFIQSIDQMEYLYDAALTYAEYFKTYANFS